MSVSWMDFNEKRNFRRMRVNAEVSFLIVDGDGSQCSGSMKDLSSTGMLMETATELRVGQKLDMTVPTESEKYLDLRAIMEVIRVDVKESGEGFVCGLLMETLIQ